MIDTHFHLMRLEPSGDGSDLADYARERRRLGIEAAIVVQPSAHRYDASVTLGAVERHPDWLKAVVAAPPEIGANELAWLKSKGAVGVRLNMVHNPDQAAGPEAAFLRKIRDAGLFLQVFASGERLARLTAWLREVLPGDSDWKQVTGENPRRLLRGLEA